MMTTLSKAEIMRFAQREFRARQKGYTGSLNELYAGIVARLVCEVIIKRMTPAYRSSFLNVELESMRIREIIEAMAEEMDQ